MSPVKSFDDYSPWTESTGNIKRLDRMASLFILILYRKFTIHISFIKKILNSRVSVLNHYSQDPILVK